MRIIIENIIWASITAMIAILMSNSSQASTAYGIHIGKSSDGSKTISMMNPKGKLVGIEPKELQKALDHGYRLITKEEAESYDLAHPNKIKPEYNL